MARTFLRQDTQIRNSDLYDDTLAAGSTLESVPTNIEDDLNSLRSQAKRAIWDDAAGNWYDDIPTINGKKRGIRDLNFDLDDIEEKKVLCRVTVLTDIAVPAAQNWYILSVAGSEAPTLVAAVALTQDGAVVAQSALSGAGFDVHELIEVAGPSPINPKNLLVVRDAVTGQMIQSSGRDVFGLLQYESTGVDGAAFDDVSAGNRVKISFVRLTSGLDDLEACPVADIENKSINYAYVRRLRFDSMPEDCWLGYPDFVDQVASVDVTLDRAIDNQSGPATQIQTIEVRITDSFAWRFEDSTGARNLLRVAPAVAGDEVTIDADVITFTNPTNNTTFTNGFSADTTGTQLNFGVTAGQIDSAGALTVTSAATFDARIIGANELYLDDGNQTGSTWAQTNGIKLSDTTAEWDNFETAFGEVSLLNAITQAYNASARGTKVYANVTSTTNADTDVGGVGGGANLDAQLPDMSGGTFITDYDVFLNGALLRGGANSGANHDYYPGTSLVNGQLKFEFKVKNNDVICVVPYA